MTKRRGRRILFWALGALLALFILFQGFISLLGAPSLFPILFLLAVGWWSFLQRTIPNITVNWAAISTGIFCVVGALFLARWLTISLLNHSVGAEPGERRGRWKWIASTLAGAGLSFAAALAVGGLAHQTAWLFTSDEPWFERVYPTPTSSWTDSVLHRVTLPAAPERIRQAIWSLERDSPDRLGPVQDQTFLMLLDDEDSVSALLIFPRDRHRLWRSGVWILRQEETGFRPLTEDLEAFLQENQARLLAF